MRGKVPASPRLVPSLTGIGLQGFAMVMVSNLSYETVSIRLLRQAAVRNGRRTEANWVVLFVLENMAASFQCVSSILTLTNLRNARIHHAHGPCCTRAQIPHLSTHHAVKASTRNSILVGGRTTRRRALVQTSTRTETSMRGSGLKASVAVGAGSSMRTGTCTRENGLKTTETGWGC